MTQTAIENLKEEQRQLRRFIHIKGARSNNLRNVEVKIPKKELVVVVGMSGSGKSSLIIDTLYAEGQRRYVESLSSYARQFLNRMKKPEVDFIKGICPAIAIEQRVSSSNARSTVGSLTEIYDYLRLLYARIGVTYSPISGDIVKKHEVSDVVDFIKNHKLGTKINLTIPVQNKYDRTLGAEFDLLIKKGYTRVFCKDTLHNMQDLIEDESFDGNQSVQSLEDDYYILIDRFALKEDKENEKRIADSILTAFAEGEGECRVEILGGETVTFNNRFELDGMVFLEPTHQLFNYNNPYGACPRCEGYGKILGISSAKVIPDDTLSVYDEAIACWRGEKGKLWLQNLIDNAHYFHFPVHKPVRELSAEDYDLLWNGNEYFDGIFSFFDELESKTYKIQNRVLLARYRGRTICTECKGGRLRKEADYVKIDQTPLSKLINVPITELSDFINGMNLTDHQKAIGERIILEIYTRLQVMVNIGLGYLSLNRLASTLSGGETQRINLTRTLGSNLTNSLYILDEPSIGLHPKDTGKLVNVLKNLRDLGNTVVVVEHEEDVIRNADYILEIGPLAGVHGGQLVYAGPYSEFNQGVNSLTSEYISGQREIPVPLQTRKIVNKIIVKGCRQHNLKNIDITIPLNNLVAISGVSGSGKSTFVKHILHPALLQHLGEIIPLAPGKHSGLEGDLSRITSVEMVNQSPIGRSSRSNPVTYVKAYDAIRKLFANQQLSKIRGYQPKHFSFNVEGGRCETCKGDGNITVEMQFLADVTLVCDECNGQRFKSEILEVKYDDKNINDVLNLTVEEALEFFLKKKDIVAKLQPLFDVGLGYVQLGQSSSTLSGGEAQRVKLASFLGKENSSKNILFIFDEPTTGLHFHDILKLMDAFNALVENGHTVLVVEHNLDVLKAADWIIDLGPEGGNDGGNLVYEGPVRGILDCKSSYTGQYLREKFNS
jgi:excinuclease ABC subunit A